MPSKGIIQKTVTLTIYGHEATAIRQLHMAYPAIYVSYDDSSELLQNTT